MRRETQLLKPDVQPKADGMIMLRVKSKARDKAVELQAQRAAQRGNN